MSTAHVHESPAELLIELELPELDPDEIEVTVLGYVVTVRGGREVDLEGFGKQPGASTTFRRELQLPQTADVEHLTATLRGGTLELHAPKCRPKPRRIEVRMPWRLNGSACPD